MKEIDNIVTLLRFELHEKSLKNIAKEVGISTSALSCIARGKNPNLINFIKLSRYFVERPGVDLFLDGYQAACDSMMKHIQPHIYLKNQK